MTRKRSEVTFGAALRDVDESVPTYVYRPPDVPGPSSRKPCDFMVWTLARYELTVEDGFKPIAGASAWFECKHLNAAVAETFPFRLLEPGQLQGIRDAKRLGVDYWLAIWWERHKMWTISDAVRMEAVGYFDGSPERPKALARNVLGSVFGVDSTPKDLSSTLKSILAGEVR